MCDYYWVDNCLMIGFSVRVGKNVRLLMISMILMIRLIKSGLCVGKVVVVIGVVFLCVRELVIVSIGMIRKNLLINIVILIVVLYD